MITSLGADFEEIHLIRYTKVEVDAYWTFFESVSLSPTTT